MEEKKITVIINKSKVELSSNNPNLKELVECILAQEDDYDFNKIDVLCDTDSNFDKESFKSLIIKSISEQKKLLSLEEIKNKTLLNEIQ